jgi:putative mRNA 3-end processing factor
VRCDTFITESTFGLPIYRWRPRTELFSDIDRWWREKPRGRGRASVVYAYALGKSAARPRRRRRVDRTDLHARRRRTLERRHIELPACRYPDASRFGNARAPTISAARSSSQPPVGAEHAMAAALRRRTSIAFALRAGCRSAGYAGAAQSTVASHVRSRGRAGSVQAISATHAQRVFVTHVTAIRCVRWLGERGIDAKTLVTRLQAKKGAQERRAPIS